MALNWSIADVKDTHLLHNTKREGDDEPPFPKGSDEDWEGDRQWEITDAIIWATMAVDIGEIKESNYEEFYARLKMVEKVYGGRPYQITLADLKRRIGLGTNVITTTPAAFANRMKKTLVDDAHRKAKREMSHLDKYERFREVYDTLLEADVQAMEKLRVEYIEPHLEKCRAIRREAQKENA